MANGVITLGEMRAKGMTMLEVACRRCERRGRPRIEWLIAEHGAWGARPARHHHAGLSTHAEPLTSIYGPCGVHLSRRVVLTRQRDRTRWERIEKFSTRRERSRFEPGL